MEPEEIKVEASSDLGGALRGPAPVEVVRGKEYWKGLLGRKERRLTDEESMLMVQLMLAELQAEGQPAFKAEAVAKFFPYQVIKKRFEGAGLKASECLVFMLASLSRTPAEAVMFAYTAALAFAKVKERNAIPGVPDEAIIAEGIWNTLDMTLFGEHMFPWGIPEEAARETAWDEQKLAVPQHGMMTTDNMVDNFKYWPLPAAKADDQQQPPEKP